jgi:hypothetical protein
VADILRWDDYGIAQVALSSSAASAQAPTRPRRRCLRGALQCRGGWRAARLTLPCARPAARLMAPGLTCRAR